MHLAQVLTQVRESWRADRYRCLGDPASAHWPDVTVGAGAAVIRDQRHGCRRPGVLCLHTDLSLQL